jgi:hypothetical protein
MGHFLKFLLALFFLSTEAPEEARRREWKEAADSGNLGLKFLGDLVAGAASAVLAGLFIYAILTQGLAGLAMVVVIFNGLLIVALIFLFLTILFRPELGFGARLGIYFVLAALAAMMFANRPERPRTSQPIRNVVKPHAAEEKPFERTEWIVRNELVAKVDQLRADARARWRADLVAAGATGAPGVVPPILEVKPKGPGIWQVKNLSPATVCVRLARVSQPEYGKGRWLRCPLDVIQECSEILAGTTRHLTLEVNDRVAGCVSTLLEYEVGTFNQPEPSWWSATALENLDAPDSSPDRAHTKWSLEQLRDEITRLERLLAQADRAARWRRELAGAKK